MRRILAVILSLLLLITTVSCEAPQSNLEAPSTFSVTMLDVGQGLSILVECDGHNLLFDGGGRDSSSYVVSYLKSHNINHFDFVIASHYDEDHLSGCIGVLSTCDVDKVLASDYETDTGIYQSFVDKIEETGVIEEFPEAGAVYELGSAVIEVLGPLSHEGSENNQSIVLRITCGKLRILLTGDAEEEEEEQLIEKNRGALAADLLVLGHHGSAYSTSDAFLDAVKPSTVWISVGVDNSYGHPAEETLSRIKARNVDMYRTDVQGEVTLSYENGEIVYSIDPCQDFSPGKISPLDVSDDEGGSYVLNVSTKKFHLPSCSSVDQMKEKNKRVVEEAREELIAEGYEPCKNCRP